MTAEPHGTAGPDDGAFDIAAFIDGQPIGPAHVRLILLCAATLFMDGFDTQAIGYVAPALAGELGLSRGALGPVFASGLSGLMLGALIFGPVADTFGRRRVIIASTVAFGALSLATALVDDVSALMAVRFLTGLGLGGAMPNTVALTSEFSPRQRRATMVMIMFVGFSVGAALGGLVAAVLIPAFGWRSVFLVGGVVPLLLVPLLIAHLPESARFLALSRRTDDRLPRLIAGLYPDNPIAPGTVFTVREQRLPGFPLSHLFSEGRAGPTLLLWVIFFMSLLDLYFLSNWLPTVVSDLGVSLSLAVVIGSLLQVGGVIGTLTLGRFIDRFSFGALALTYAVATVAVAVIGMLGHSIPLVAAAITLAGFCIVGGQIAANALAATFYPTSIRSTGVGWALGIGRVGSIIGPLAGGALLALHWGTAPLFMVAAIPAAIAAAAAAVLARRSARASRAAPDDAMAVDAPTP